MGLPIVVNTCRDSRATWSRNHSKFICGLYNGASRAPRDLPPQRAKSARWGPGLKGGSYEEGSSPGRGVGVRLQRRFLIAFIPDCRAQSDEFLRDEPELG